MTISRMKLRAISDLKLAKRLDEMGSRELDEYVRKLEDFVDAYPVQEEALKRAFLASNMDFFVQALQSIKDMLSRIYADDLVLDCLKLISDAKAGRLREQDAYLTHFFTSMSSLSIDIQVAQMKQKDETAWGPYIIRHEGVDSSRQKGILAVDDVPLLLSSLRNALQNTAYKFTGVTSGEAALKCLHVYHPDLFILDIEMPMMNGYELAVKIREAGFQEPIIFLTGNSTKEYLLKALQAGGVDFLVKPVNKNYVLEKIRKYIGS